VFCGPFNWLSVAVLQDHKLFALHVFGCPATRAFHSVASAFCMGTSLSCCPRRAHQRLQDELDLVNLTALPQPRTVWHKAVRRVVSLLALRKLWSRLGNFLSAIKHTSARTHLSPAQVSLVKKSWTVIGRWITRFAPVFSHLRKKNGRLAYSKEKAAGWQASSKGNQSSRTSS
jgi:hypothetical protein